MNSKLNNKIQLIEEKMKGDSDSKNETYARLLKRRRLEQKKTLEDVALGVCSTSYLCRIENAQVEVKDDFLTHLFEKLKINYDEVKELSKVNILDELIRSYYLENMEKVDNLINKSIESNIYSDIEIQLITLFKNIIDGSYEEARSLLNEIDKVITKLVGQELIVYTFLSSLLAYRTNNLVTSFKLLKVLLSVKYNSKDLKKAIFDLALTVSSMLDEDILFVETYNEYKQIFTLKPNYNKDLAHEIEYRLICGKNNVIKGVDLFNEVKEYLSNDTLIEHYNYNYLKFLIYHRKYSDAFDLLDNIEKSNRMIPLLNYCVNNCGDFLKAINYLNEIKHFKFGKYETFSLFYNEFTIINIEKRNNYELIEFVKKNFLHPKNVAKETKNSFIISNIYRIYRMCLFDLGKYKEAAKYALDE